MNKMNRKVTVTMDNTFLELLEKNGKVSLMDDIIPVVMNEFWDIPASGNTNQMVMDFVRQNITAAIISMDKKVIATPVIVCDPQGNGYSVVDFIYEVVVV